MPDLFTIFDDTDEREGRAAFYAGTPAVEALILVVSILALTAVGLALAKHEMLAPVGLTWACLSAVTAGYEWHAGFRATAKNHLVRIGLFLPTLLMVWLLRHG